MPYEPQLNIPLLPFEGGGIDFQHSAIEMTAPAQNEEMHLHDSCEIYVNVSGNGAFMVEKALYPITRGDIIITRPNELHHAVFRPGAVHEHYCIWFRVREDSPFAARFFGRERGEGNLLSPSGEEKERLLRLLAAMENKKETPPALTVAFLRVLALIDQSEAAGAEPTDLPEPLGAILGEIRQEYREQVRFSEIAKRHFISQSTLGRLFHTYLHVSPHGYLEDLRMAEAKRLLAAGADVTAAAFHSGFSDASHFILLFRRRFGITPGKYRTMQESPENK